MKKNDIIKYILAFVITGTIFITAFLLSDRLSANRMENIRSVEDRISIDILSSETQFALLRDSSCKQFSDSILSQELNTLAQKLDFMERDLGTENDEVLHLKRYYSLLQIKDYILMHQLSERCSIKPTSIIYFYSNKEECPDCVKQAYVLSYLREKYPRLRVYAFDYDLNLSAIDTLIKLNKVERRFPALVLPDNVLYGFTSIENVEKHVPNIKDLSNTNASSSASSTISTK